MAEMLNKNQTFATPGEALAHHGVKGMKWGVRKEDATVGEGEGALVAVTAVYAGLMVIRARYNYVDSGKKHAKELDKTAKKTGVEHEWKKNDSLTGPKSIDDLMKDVVAPINKGFPKESGTSMNCRRCTFAYEMRRRGNDVKATRTLSATGQDTAGLVNATSKKGADKSTQVRHESWWGQNTIPTTEGRRYMTADGKAESIFNTLGKQPNGSRGELAFGWAFGGGHSIAYEIVDNKPVIFDNQSGKFWSDTKAFARDMTPIMGEAAFTRLDNVKLNDDFVKRWVDHAD